MSSNTQALIADQLICEWYEALSEAYIRSLIALHDDHELTPRKAWHYVFGEFSSANCTCRACLLSLPARRTFLRPVPAQIQSESFAAPALEAQGQGTPTLEDFQRWLENRAHAQAHFLEANPQSKAAQLELSACRIATSLLLEFKQEQCA